MDPSWELQTREKRSIEPSKNYETERRELRNPASLWIVTGLVKPSMELRNREKRTIEPCKKLRNK